MGRRRVREGRRAMSAPYRTSEATLRAEIERLTRERP